MNVYTDPNNELKNKPVGELTGHDDAPVSERAIRANPGIFGYDDGEKTSIQAYNTIKDRVDNALQLIERRLDIARSISASNDIIATNNGELLTSTPNRMSKPKPRPTNT